MSEETRSLTVRLPHEVYANLRRESFENYRPMSKILIEALEQRYAGVPETPPPPRRSVCGECGLPTVEIPTADGPEWVHEEPQSHYATPVGKP
jgi:hypothetical protein